jgi:hypothetical protein
MSEWISVKDMLPVSGKINLVSNGKGVTTGSYEDFYQEFILYNTVDRKIEDVTHWMPLPNPPEE